MTRQTSSGSRSVRRQRWSVTGRAGWLLLLALPCVATISVQQSRAHEGFPELARFSDIHMEKAFSRDCETTPGSITYTLLDPARVRVRVVAAGTRELFLRHIVDWEFREAGIHTETWDCKDNSGHRIERAQAVIRLIGEPMSSYSPGTMPLEKLSVEETIHGHRFGHTHNKHHEYACRESQLRIVSPMEGERISGKAVIRTTVDSNRRGYGDTFGYGLRYYVDRELVNEQFYKPESEGQFVYELDTTAFADGEHLIHLGMCDHNDHATAASVVIVIDNDALRRKHRR